MTKPVIQLTIQQMYTRNMTLPNHFLFVILISKWSYDQSKFYEAAINIFEEIIAICHRNFIFLI